MLTTGHAADFYDPQCLRASIGTLFARPFAALESMQDAFDWMNSLPVRLNVVGTSAHGTCLLDEVDLTGPTLLLIGNETFGLSKGWKECCDVLAKIPIQGSASSLNAGMRRIHLSVRNRPTAPHEKVKFGNRPARFLFLCAKRPRLRKGSRGEEKI